MKQNKDSFDILKIVLAIFVVGIHSELGVTVLNPLFRTAVPLFFMTSGYFFFNKEKSKINLKKFIKRNLRLYVFWFIALLPITIYIRNWYQKPLLDILKDVLMRFFFNSTFRASWFIMALIIGISAIYYMSMLFSDKRILFVCTIIYCVLCLTSNYYGLFSADSGLIILYERYVACFGSLTNSWLASLLWICLGKIIAAKENTGKYNLKVLVSIGVFSFFGLYIEQIFILKASISKENDCYFFLIPLCIAVFLIILKLDIICEKAYVLRKMSTILYVTHASMITVVSFMLKIFEINSNFLVFIVTMIIGLGIYSLIDTLEKRKIFGWIKYSY